MLYFSVVVFCFKQISTSPSVTINEKKKIGKIQKQVTDRDEFFVSIHLETIIVLEKRLGEKNEGGQIGQFLRLKIFYITILV